MEFFRRVREFCSFLARKKYEEGKTDAEIEAIRRIRLQEYGKICQIGLANMFWNGTTDVMKELALKNKDGRYHSVTGFTCALLCMIVGAAVAAFPDSAPCPMFFAGFGAWQAVLCLFGSYHLDMVPFFLRPQDSIKSMVITSALFTVYWGLIAQDPWFCHLIGRLLLWICDGIWKLMSKAGDAVKKLRTRSARSFFLRKSLPRDQSLVAKSQP